MLRIVALSSKSPTLDRLELLASVGSRTDGVVELSEVLAFVQACESSLLYPSTKEAERSARFFAG